MCHCTTPAQAAYLGGLVQAVANLRLGALIKVHLDDGAGRGQGRSECGDVMLHRARQVYQLARMGTDDLCARCPVANSTPQIHRPAHLDAALGQLHRGVQVEAANIGGLQPAHAAHAAPTHTEVGHCAQRARVVTSHGRQLQSAKGEGGSGAGRSVRRFGCIHAC